MHDDSELDVHRATGKRRGSRVQQCFQLRQTDNESSLLEIECVRDCEGGAMMAPMMVMYFAFMGTKRGTRG